MIELSHIIMMILCMIAVAFFSGIETGVISINRMRLQHFVRLKDLNAKILQGFVENSDRLLGTTLVGTNVFMVITSVVSASLAVRILGSWGEAISSLFVSILVLVFSEYLPKSWFRARPYERSRHFASLLRMSEIIFRPFSKSILWLTNCLVPGPVKSFSKPAPFATIEDLKALVRESEKDGALSKSERVMIHRVFELSGKTAAQIMTPKDKMIIADGNMTIAEFFKLSSETGLTRMPVWDKKNHQYTGIINVFYLLSTGDDIHSRRVKEFIRPPLFIPEHMPVDDIFPRLRRSQQPMCLVQNDKSEVTGLITTEDILEEIIGKI